MQLRKLLFSFFLFTILSALALQVKAQQATLTGTITDAENKALFGATVAVFGQPFGTTTDDKGNFTLSVPAEKNLRIVLSYTGLQADTLNVNLKSGERKDISKSLKGRVVQIKDVVIEDKSFKSNNITRINPKIVSVIPTPNQSVEDLIKRLPGVNSTNELSSGYSVRGGNFDENLVYINDFEIYRPILVRSGQQEGLSIINPDMVDEIKFSAGGFDAYYGDKLSSVLDIKYRKPKKFAGAISGSLLGGSLQLENRSKNGKWYYNGGVRQKSNQYLLNTFDTKGEYLPSFTDVQIVVGHEINKKWSVEMFGNYARNRFNLTPTDRETNFGTINDAKRFTVYFEGKERDRYDLFTGAFSLHYKPNEKVNLHLIGSGFSTREEENFDILGQYFLDQLETDLGKDEFGDVAFNLGIGSFLNHARNRLEGDAIAVEHKGEYITDKVLYQWGVKYQHEDISDKLHEWNYIDSAGFSIPSSRDSLNPQLILNDVVISKNNIVSNRISGYLQTTWQITDTNKIILTTGIRANYWDYNKQLVVSPRASVTIKPQWSRSLNFRAATGFYYQPPFYRELRDLSGQLYPETRAQRSIHAIVGADYRFLALGREFKLTGEFFYKFLTDIIPYKIVDIRVRYLPNYTARGYARGMDFRLFGDFVPGVESWASLSFLQTAEDIQGDVYYRRFNADGEEIVPGFTFDQIATDSIKVEPGFIPRPTDQRVSFSIFFQDYLPKFPTYKMQLSLFFGTALPFGPPGTERYKDLLRTPLYRRVDIGFSKQLIGEEVKKRPQGKFFNSFDSMWIGLEVFNLLQVSNVASYSWITDVSTARKYAVPNYLTGRQINLRLTAHF